MAEPKSVKFQDEATIMDSGADSEAPAADPAPATATDEVSDMFNDLKLKKKKKKSKKSTATSEFDALVKQAEAGQGADEAKTEEPVNEEDVWGHDSTSTIPYAMLLSRFFEILHDSRPEGMSGGKSYKIPPPQCLREGSKKTVFANISEISHRMKRNDEHVIAFLYAELGTSGSVDASRRLILKGRFQQKQIENVLRRYIVEYVTCRTCRSPDTTLSKGENRLSFVECKSCGSRRSVSAIKTGFSAQIGKRKRKVG